jgi:hypothetical protein
MDSVSRERIAANHALVGSSFILSSYHQYSTRSQDIDHISLRLTKSQDGIHYYCIKFFNALPDSHKNLPPNQFLKHIKTYLLNKIIYSFDEFLNNSSNDLK